MGMEHQQQQYDQRRGHNSMCLVCGRQGGNSVVVTSVHSFVSASGTPLSDFLVKVVGEDPCYSVSEVICQQCFVLLDRLDAYQARAAEIHTHLTSRYQDTKLELLGQRKRMSELIATSLSNVQELRHGTTLNVSDELTITVVHEALPKRSRNSFRLENGSLYSHLRPTGDSRYSEVKEDAFSRLISQKLKKRKVPQPSSDTGFSSNKRRKLLAQNSLSASDNNNVTSNNNNNNNNNSISYAKSVKNRLFVNQDYLNSVNRTLQREPPRLVSEVKDNSDEEYASDGDEESGSDVEASRDSVDEGPEVEKDKDEEEQEEEESSDDSSSDSDDDDDDGSGGGEEDDDDDEEEEEEEEEKDSEHAVEQADGSACEADEDEEEEQEESAHLSDADEGEELDIPSQKPESSPSQKTKGERRSLKQVKSQDEVCIKEEPAEDHPVVKEEPATQLQIPPGVAVPPQIAEAMLMQSPLATSLLQSFLATSLWFGSPESSNKKAGNQSKPKQDQQAPDDFTREMLAVAVGSTKDKKKRQELKNTGQSYINTKGKLVNAKRVWPQDCSRCPLKCNARISEDDRQKIFAEYWGLADYNLQREYLAAHMQREEKLGPSGLLRTVILYFLTQGKEKKLQVCRQFFLKTLDVSEKASRIVLEKMVRGELGTDSTAPSPAGVVRPLSAQGESHELAKDNDASNMSTEDCDVKKMGKDPNSPTTQGEPPAIIKGPGFNEAGRTPQKHYNTDDGG